MPATVLIALTFLVIVATIFATKAYTATVVIFLTLITIVLAALCVFAALQTAMNRQSELVRRQLNQMLQDLRNTEREDAARRLVNEANEREARRLVNEANEREARRIVNDENERNLAAARARARAANLIRRAPATNPDRRAPVTSMNEAQEILRQSAAALGDMPWADMMDERDERDDAGNQIG